MVNRNGRESGDFVFLTRMFLIGCSFGSSTICRGSAPEIPKCERAHHTNSRMNINFSFDIFIQLKPCIDASAPKSISRGKQFIAAPS